jgi:glycosyltransferase involved in cell wall biosynthesis
VSIGIGITTRNRPHVLKTALQHFERFGYGDKLVVVDDNSDDPDAIREVVESFGLGFILRRSDQRMGIAKAKNACLSALSDCDHVFLFDDDAWPCADNWAQRWVDINQHNGVGHSMWNIFVEKGTDTPEQVRTTISLITELSEGKNTMRVWAQCLGVMLYFSRECLNAIGGYDHSARTVYGFEHAQVSQRANRAGFCKGHNYLSPAIALELIYSFDVSYGWLRQESPIEIPWKDQFTTSVTVEEAQSHPQNAFLMSKKDVFIPLVDPIN